MTVSQLYVLYNMSVSDVVYFKVLPRNCSGVSEKFSEKSGTEKLAFIPRIEPDTG
jgi:hypothetical protein